MSGIAGIINLDGTKVERKLLLKMADAVKGRGPDGLKIWQEDHVGLVHSHFWTTPEELGEEQPISDESSWLISDARIDNREELQNLLKNLPYEHNPSDAELILAAYNKWGKNSPRYLIGDFAFAIWDSAEQQLFCARDPSGIKLLHYSKVDDSLFFASSVHAIISVTDSHPQPNFPFIGDLLAGRYDRWINETAYQNVFRLPSAYCLSANTSSITLKRYWTFGEGPGYHFKTDEEYISCFRDLFRMSVRARSRAIGTIGLTVSGGLDSSSIACTLDNLIAAREIKAKGCIYSSIYNNTPSADEKDYLDAAISRCSHLEAVKIPSDELWGLREFMDDNDFPMDDPEVEMFRSLLLAQLRRAKKDGCRVVLSGYGGDEVLYTDVYSTPSSLKDVGLSQLLAELPNFRKYTRSIPKIITYAYITPKLPASVKRFLYRQISDKNQSRLLKQIYSSNGQRSNLFPMPKLYSDSSRQIYINLTDGGGSAWQIMKNNLAAYAGIDWRFPFYDRRLIEFMLSLPPRLCFREGFSRYILRLSMQNDLPDKICWRISKAHLGDLQKLSLHIKEKKRVQRLIENSQAVKLGFVDAYRLEKAWESYWNNHGYPERPLVRFLCAEAWLRSYDEQSRSIFRAMADN